MPSPVELICWYIGFPLLLLLGCGVCNEFGDSFIDGMMGNIPCSCWHFFNIRVLNLSRCQRHNEKKNREALSKEFEWDSSQGWFGIAVKRKDPHVLPR